MGDNMEQPDFASVTEVTGYKVTKEQIQRMYSRYSFASGFCGGKDVLEVACGSGQGLGFLAKKAKKVIGVDIDTQLLQIAGRYYSQRDNIQFSLADAHQLPFADNSFDVVILYEAIYYLAHPERFINEAGRVLRKEGVLLICTANKDWADFNPSPYSYKYFSAPGLVDLLSSNRFIKVGIYGNCPVKDKTIRSKVISYLKRMVVTYHLMPKTMKGKEFFKRLFFGKLTFLPSEIEECGAPYYEPVPVLSGIPNSEYKVIFAVGHVEKGVGC